MMSVYLSGIMKRSFDFMLAAVGLIFSMPLWCIIGIAIIFDDGLPVFYVQERVGKDNILFPGMKFRSMIIDAEKGVGPVQAIENDPRVTRVGKLLRKTAMDELPQLINIIRGDMSFVGPRALRPTEIEVVTPVDKDDSSSELFKSRHRIKPGLTGVAQVYAPRDLPRQEKLKYDLWYINNRTFLLDISLILQSFWITFNKKWDTADRNFRKKIV